MRNNPAFLLVILILLAAALFSACNSGGVEGEIIWISAQIDMNQAQAGELEDIAYLGTVTVKLLDTGEVVKASCPRDFLQVVEGAPAFTVDKIEGGLIASIDIKLQNPAKVLLVQDNEENWEVTEVLKE